MTSSFLHSFSSLCITTSIIILIYLYYHIILSITLFLLIVTYFMNKPLLELFTPHLLLNFHTLHDKIAQALEKNNGTFFLLKNINWMGHKDLLFTSDPKNIRHIMTSKFSNYVKGPEWKEHFDIFGDHSIFNSDLENWKWIRKMAQWFLSNHSLQKYLNKVIYNVTASLVSTLDRVSKEGITVDLQDLGVRYSYDIASSIAYGRNPNSLLDFGSGKTIPYVDALENAFEATYYRILSWDKIWKVQRWLGMGKEKILVESWKTIDEFCMEITSKRLVDKDLGFNLLSCYLSVENVPSQKFMRDTITNLIFATQGTTSGALAWFFYLVSKNPLVEAKIKEEIIKNWSPTNLDESFKKLVYLHATLCEAMRLYPPAPYEWRNPIGPDTLPSGHKVDQNTKIVISSYAIGRMKSVWGEDSWEFKPERWITKDGGIKYEHSYKFFAFNTGPRTCLGKDIAFNLMKPFVANIFYNYDVEFIEGEEVIPTLSVLLRIKNGLMVRIKKRSVSLRREV